MFPLATMKERTHLIAQHEDLSPTAAIDDTLLRAATTSHNA
jgi:hypothetical protein